MLLLLRNDLLLPSGYINMAGIIEGCQPFTFIFGARGTGKTYGALLYLISNHIPFLYMRRTQTQLDAISTPEMSPFKSIDPDITVKSIRKHLVGVYDTEEVDGEMKPVGAPLGYMLALSTISNLRGFDMSNVKVLIFDEFEGEAHESRMRNEDTAFFNAYETINRNRELQGQPPLKAILMANSNNMAVPIIMAMRLVHPLEVMAKKGIPVQEWPDRGITVILMSLTPISEQKKNTALYKAVGSGTFTEMAIENKFSANDMTNVVSRSYKEYTPAVNVGELYIYKHKSRDEYYISMHQHGSFSTVYGADTVSLKKWRRDYAMIWLHHLNRLIFFEGYTEKVLFEKYFNMNI